MTATGKSSGSSSSVLRPLSSSSSQRIHHHHQPSSSPCNLNICLRFSPGNIPKPSSNQKKKCSCSPTTHPGSFRCAFHRRLENEKSKTLVSPSPNRNNTTRNGGLYLRKLALMNSLARIGIVMAERFIKRSLAATRIKPSFLHVRRRRLEFRTRPSRFGTFQKDQD